jgi:hypothetical protein
MNLDGRSNPPVGQAAGDTVIQEAFALHAGQNQDESLAESLGRAKMLQETPAESPERMQKNAENRMAAAEKAERHL